jgi:hypothetical protein
MTVLIDGNTITTTYVLIIVAIIIIGIAVTPPMARRIM